MHSGIVPQERHKQYVTELFRSHLGQCSLSEHTRPDCDHFAEALQMERVRDFPAVNCHYFCVGLRTMTRTRPSDLMLPPVAVLVSLMGFERVI